MEQTSMTALVSAFARAYHAKNDPAPVFRDTLAEALLTREEYDSISRHMARGISFFDPSFRGTEEEALRRVVDRNLSPAPLGRAAFAEQELERAASNGAAQYLILGAGYDTFSYRQPRWARALQIFEVDLPGASADKQARLARAGISIPGNVHRVPADLSQPQWCQALLAHPCFDPNRVSFCSLLGVAYYLPAAAFDAFLGSLADILAPGSVLVFDCPDELSHTGHGGDRAKAQIKLAGGAGEPMFQGWSRSALEEALTRRGFLLRKFLTPPEITRQFFSAHNHAQPEHPITAMDHVDYCLAQRV